MPRSNPARSLPIVRSSTSGWSFPKKLATYALSQTGIPQSINTPHEWRTQSKLIQVITNMEKPLAPR
ncbi:hypothetical protein CA13_30500 [Planctomycetes bacterium CA13]|uniref:Uncharacterized protein n=1 Tax=Novipirellula herctigrandis TaxID=2527986 RepID=A0A5C5Z3Q7_9BACT|nr:hypothetical protein CA13_30500 [Planctomycetes bacterium CA13]